MKLDEVRHCCNCELCVNQKPLLDSAKICNVFWVGLSAKKAKSNAETPLSPETNTGLLIKKIEDMCESVVAYKTNLVKCLPLNDKHKLRYPNKDEIDSCFNNLLDEIHLMSPKIIFLLGEKVSSSVSAHLNIKFVKRSGFEYNYIEHEGAFFVPIHHPSYIRIYKYKEMDLYLTSVKRVIDTLL